MYIAYDQYVFVQKRIQEVHELHELYQKKIDAQGLSEGLDDSCVSVEQEYPAVETAEIIAEPVQDSSDDDFQFLSAEEEKILAEAKAELERYRKKIARQRAKKRAEKKAAKVAARKKKKPAKKGVKKQKEKRVKIPTMAYLKRSKATNAFFDWPVDLSLFWLSSVYGPRKHPRGGKRFHYGIDLAALRGTPVMAAASGTVVEARHVSGYGNNIIIKHNNTYKTRYAHLHKIQVKPGQRVKQGQKIGTVGATGYVRKSGRDASHLHFEIYVHGKHVNPLKYLLNE